MRDQRMLKSIIVSFILSIVASTAHAQATRTWVSGVGDDANPCSRTAPCKTFAGAISKTAAGGIIDALDPGGFGAVTITKAITIESPEKTGGVLNSLVNGIVVSAGASDTVTLRGIAIDGTGNGTNGVRFLTGGRLVMEDCYIAGATTGIDFEPSAGSKLLVNNTTINKISGTAVLVQAGASGSASAVFNNVRLINSGIGLNVVKGIASLNGSVISGNNSTGVKAAASAGATARITMDATQVSEGGGVGVNAQGAQSTVFMSNSTVTNNLIGLSAASGGAITSFGNNRIIGNTTDGSPTSTIAEH